MGVSSSMSNLQRGFWSFLFFTLVGPAFAALGVLIIVPLMLHNQIGPYAGSDFGVLGIKEAPAAAQTMTYAAFIAVRSYIWSAVPAAISGLLFALILWRDWYSGWGTAGCVGVFGFMIAAIAMPFSHGGLLAYIAVFAGFVAIACRACVVKAGVIPPTETA